MNKFETFEGKLMSAVHDAIKENIDEEIEKAKERLEKLLRRQAAQVAINIAKWVDVQSMQDRIVITFKQE